MTNNQTKQSINKICNMINIGWISLVTIVFLWTFIRKFIKHHQCRGYIKKLADRTLFFEFDIVLKKKLRQKAFSRLYNQEFKSENRVNFRDSYKQVSSIIQKSSYGDLDPGSVYYMPSDNKLNIQSVGYKTRSYSIKDIDNEYIYIDQEKHQMKYSNLEIWVFTNAKYFCLFFIQIGNFYYSPILSVLNQELDLQNWMLSKPNTAGYVTLRIVQPLLISIYLFFMYFSYSFVVSLLTNRQEITSFAILKLNRQKLSKILHFHFNHALSYSLMLALETLVISITFETQFADMNQRNCWFWIQKNMVYLLWLNKQIFTSDFITDNAQVLKNQNKLTAIQNVIDKYVPQENFYLQSMEKLITRGQEINYDNFQKQCEENQHKMNVISKYQLFRFLAIINKEKYKNIQIMLPASHSFLTILAIYLIINFLVTITLCLIIMIYNPQEEFIIIIKFLVFFADNSIFAILIYKIFYTKRFFGKNYIAQRQQAQHKIKQILQHQVDAHVLLDEIE